MSDDPEALEFYCGGINWRVERYDDPWRCPAVAQDADGKRLIHQCAASYDHVDYDLGSDHVCAMGHRWPQIKPRRTWRDRIRRRRR